MESVPSRLKHKYLTGGQGGMTQKSQLILRLKTMIGKNGSLKKTSRSNSDLRSKAKKMKMRLLKTSLVKKGRSTTSKNALESTHATHQPIGSGAIRHASFLERKPILTKQNRVTVQIRTMKIPSHRGQKTHSILSSSQITTQTNSTGWTLKTIFNSLKVSSVKTRELPWTARRRKSSTG